MRLRQFGTPILGFIVFLLFIFVSLTSEQAVINVPKDVDKLSTNASQSSLTSTPKPSVNDKKQVANISSTTSSPEDQKDKGKNVNHISIVVDKEVKNVSYVAGKAEITNIHYENNGSMPHKTPVIAANNDSKNVIGNDSILSSTEKTISVSTEASPSSSSTATKQAVNISSTTTAPNEPVLPEKGSAEAEHNSSMAIFFVLCVLAQGIILIHFMLMTHFQYLPESVVIVFLGALIGLIINLMSYQNIGNWRKEEAFSPTAFFLVLLPPIIFESGYNLHKGNFFQNIGSILVFAIAGTTISALVIGAGIYLLGLAEVAYKLNFMESFAFGSLISAVDPVATVAIFHALDIDPVLNMLVFGESILNDAIAIVLTTSVFESNNPNMSSSEALLAGITRFCSMFFASAGIGVVFALISALLLKHVDLRKNPSLEFGMMLVFTYAPYALAEGIHLSGNYRLIINKLITEYQ